MVVKNNDRKGNSWWREAKILAELSINTIFIEPTLFLSVCFTASVIGRQCGGFYLAAFSLANTIGNITGISLVTGIISAADTLSAFAFGAGNFSEVGLVAIRCFSANILLLIPIQTITYFVVMKPFLLWIGQSLDMVIAIKQWYLCFFIFLPFFALFNSVWAFLICQDIVKPVTIISLIYCFVVTPMSLELFSPRFAFTFSQIVLPMSLLTYIGATKNYDQRTWLGINSATVKDALESKPFIKFLNLSTGGILLQSEWWFWELLVFLAGSFGELPLTVHAIPTQIISVCWMVPSGLGTALSIRIGSLLAAPGGVYRAKCITLGSFLVSLIAISCATWVLYFHKYAIYSFFTNSPEVVGGLDRIWFNVCLYNILLSQYGVLNGVVVGLGKQWVSARVSIVGLFIIGLPLVFYQSVVKGGNLEALWFFLPILYGGITSTMCIYVLFLDWESLSKEIIEENTTVILSESESESEDETLLNGGSTNNFITDCVVYGSIA